MLTYPDMSLPMAVKLTMKVATKVLGRSSDTRGMETTIRLMKSATTRTA
jgi:hypothetical protein